MLILSKGQYLSDILNEIPSNCILSKKIPGCGATTLELNTNRNSIIVVPNVPVIASKRNKYPNLLGVYEGVKNQDICKYLRENKSYHKIMTTPESFDKVKNVCEKCNINIYSDFFLLADECQQLIKDVGYREDIVIPMNDFFLFKNKALVSATPLEFSDPRFKENNFSTVEITADYDYRQDITVIHTYNTAKAFAEYIQNHNGTICIFLNSIVETYSIMAHFGLLKDSSIYCAPKSKSKLKNGYGFTNAHTIWSAETMKKYNFFTARFFTAFDLELPHKPDLLMISDPFNAEYSLLDVDTDCIQICGRFRNGLNSATHIYRVNPEIVIKSKEQVMWEISAHEVAYNTVQTLYNSADNKELRYGLGSALESLPFRKFLYPDFTKNWFAIDNEINETLVQNRYQDKRFINNWYSDCHYFNPVLSTCEYDKNDDKLKIINSARSVKDKRRKMVQMLSEIELPYSEYALDFITNMRKIDSFIVNAYEVLGKERIEELKYSQKKINEELILAQRRSNKVIPLIKNSFKVGNKYTNQHIAKELSRIFELVNIHPEKEIKPNTIKDYFQVADWRNKNSRGYMIVSEII